MPFNLQTFKTRTLTAIIFALIMVGGLLLNTWSFVLLFTIIHFGCWYEFIKLLKKISSQKYIYYLPTGLVYITLPVLIMIYIRTAGFLVWNSNYFMFLLLPCFIVFSIWINDTMAYIVGSFIGKTPFSKISPKKTWEGTIGGIILCVGIIALAGWYTHFYKLNTWIVIGAICAIFGTIGDLLESKLKRMAQVKDSGSIMPGHGGFLDRFDSLLIATPFVWLYLYFIIG